MENNELTMWRERETDITDQGGINYAWANEDGTLHNQSSILSILGVGVI